MLSSGSTSGGLRVLGFSSTSAASATSPRRGVGLGGTTAHPVVSTDHGIGTLTVDGLLTITAPTSTEPGLFTGTITFTVG